MTLVAHGHTTVSLVSRMGPIVFCGKAQWQAVHSAQPSTQLYGSPPRVAGVMEDTPRINYIELTESFGDKIKHAERSDITCDV
jgi:hypothetical protein